MEVVALSGRKAFAAAANSRGFKKIKGKKTYHEKGKERLYVFCEGSRR